MNLCKYKPLNTQTILSIIDHQQLCKLGSMQRDNITIVPMWYVTSYQKGLTFYFIITNEGSTYNNMKDTGYVCISLDDYSCSDDEQYYASIVAKGYATAIQNPYEKAYIYKMFTEKYDSNTLFNGCDKRKFSFIKVEINELTGRLYK